jgi:plastocyanin
MNRFLLLVPMLLIASLLGVQSAARAAVSPPAVTITLRVGDGMEVANGGALANQFLPSSITIHKGDSIHFNDNSELHTTTYMPAGMPDPSLTIPNPAGPGMVFNPLVSDPTNTSSGPAEFDPHMYFNSGIMTPGDSTDVHFGVIGSFMFHCHIHEGMMLSVNVTGTATDTPSQAEVDKQGDAERDAILANDRALASAVHTTKSTTGGISTWNKVVGVSSDNDVIDALQFLPSEPLNISTGDTVKWTSMSATPHTITFGISPDAAPFPFVKIPNTGQPPVLIGFDPGVLLPSGGNIYDGTGVANSGFISRDNFFPAGDHFSLTFTKAGTYTYICQLHPFMMGTIVVSNRNTAPSAAPISQPSGTISPPNTGTGGAMQATDRTSWLAVLALITLAGSSFIIAGVRRRGTA